MKVPKEAISEERLTFLCRRPDVDEPNRDVLISYEEAITYVHPRPSQTVRGLHKMPKRKSSFKTVESLLILVTSWLFRLNIHSGNVSDNIQLKTGHLVEHL